MALVKASGSPHHLGRHAPSVTTGHGEEGEAPQPVRARRVLRVGSLAMIDIAAVISLLFTAVLALPPVVISRFRKPSWAADAETMAAVQASEAEDGEKPGSGEPPLATPSR